MINLKIYKYMTEKYMILHKEYILLKALSLKQKVLFLFFFWRKYSKNTKNTLFRY